MTGTSIKESDKNPVAVASKRKTESTRDSSVIGPFLYVKELAIILR
jgi:hypothetical protein